MQRQQMLAGAVPATELADAEHMHRQGMLAGATGWTQAGDVSWFSKKHAWATHIALVSRYTLSSCNLETFSDAQACCGRNQRQASSSSRSSTSA